MRSVRRSRLTLGLGSILTYISATNPPPITVRAAVLLIAAYALLYFIPFYLSPRTRPSPTLSRDAPSVIAARIRSVLLSCTLCCATTAFVLSHWANASGAEVLHLMGLYPLAIASSLRALGLTMLLFLGPLFSYLIVDSGWRDWLHLEPLKEAWVEHTTWRNIVAGPVTEEILFRTASIPLMLIARASVKTTVFFSPLIFGLAHFHHFYEFRLSYPGVPIAAALARSVFQLGFTTVFGAYATFVYVRTGSLFAVCLVHGFCNGMGLPRVWGKVRRVDDDEEEDEREGGRDQAAKRLPGSEKAWVKWTVGYYVLLVVGAVGFYQNLWVLTESGNALVPTSAFAPTGVSVKSL